MAKRNKFGERKRRITIEDGDRLQLVDKRSEAVVEVEFRGSENTLTVSILGNGGHSANPVLLGVDPALFGHRWQEGN